MWQDDPHQGVLANSKGCAPLRHTVHGATLERYSSDLAIVFQQWNPHRALQAVFEHSRCVMTHEALELICSFAHGKQKLPAVETANYS